jgi:hypothetical protein
MTTPRLWLLGGAATAMLITGAGLTAASAPGVTATTTATSLRPSVLITPSTVRRGGRITVTGHGWPRHVIVELLIGPPRSEADAVARVWTTTGGTFRRYLRIAPATAPGRWVLLGCRRECRIKAVRSFQVTR